MTPKTQTLTLADQALQAHLDNEEARIVQESRRLTSLSSTLRKLMKEVLDIDVEPSEDNFVVIEHFGFSWRYLAGLPELFAWWRCERCQTGRGNWQHIRSLTDLGAVEAEFRKHYPRLCRPDAA